MTLSSSLASSSIFRTRGRIRPSAKDRQESRNNCSSSDKAVNGSFIRYWPRAHRENRVLYSSRVALIQQPSGTVYNIYHMDRREPGDEHGHRHVSGETAAGSLKAALFISATFLVAEFLGAL